MSWKLYNDINFKSAHIFSSQGWLRLQVLRRAINVSQSAVLWPDSASNFYGFKRLKQTKTTEAHWSFKKILLGRPTFFTAR